MENRLLWIPVTLFVQEILNLKPAVIGYTMNDYNIKCVQITGIITAKDVTSRFIEFAGKFKCLQAVDDGTGVLSCIQWHDQTGVGLGDLVTIKGKIQDYRGKRQLNISQILVENDPNMELLRTLITISNHAIYNMPIKQLPTDHVKMPKSVKTRVYTDGIYVTETDLNSFILDWVKNNGNGNFTYNCILQESKVFSFAKNVLKYQYNDDNPDHSRLCSLVRKSIIDLTKKGLLFSLF
jgi:hypothetical protein